MFDLIDESGKDLAAYGYSVQQAKKYGITIASLCVDDDKKSKTIGLRQGRYYILSSPFLHELGLANEEFLSKQIVLKLRALLREKKVRKNDKTLLACLGNFDIAADRLGKEVFDHVEISSTRKNNHLFKFCPNIFLYTGIETSDVIKMLVQSLKIKCVIIIDSLSTSSLSRLGVSFQLSSGGMTPGSGVNRFGKAISEEDLKASCISIGVPFMISSASLKTGEEEEIMLVPKDVREDVCRAGRVIAHALCEVLL